MSNLFSSESVSVGHPDKACDQISDAILDAYLAEDPNSKVAVECLITNQNLIFAGEVSSSAKIDAIAIAKSTLKAIGYKSEVDDFNPETAKYQNFIHLQSTEINHSVSDGGAGDQGHVFGYATCETEQLLPLPYLLASELMQAHQQIRSKKSNCPLLPDAKCQVTVDYENKNALKVHSIILSSQHQKELSLDQVKEYITEHLVKPVLKKHVLLEDDLPKLFINSSGSFTVGGPFADTGLTGRKIIVDTYGGFGAHGGGAFSGKDGTKIDRSAAYAARFLAKHLVWADLAQKCTIEIGYAIGLEQPVAFRVDTHGTGKLDDDALAEKLKEKFDLSPCHLISRFGLDKPIFHETAKFGHFTNPYFPWELKDIDLIRALKNQNSRKYFDKSLIVRKGFPPNKEISEKEKKFLADNENFPYLVLKKGHNAFMQIPIRFVESEEFHKVKHYPETKLLEVSKDVLALPKSSQNEILSSRILDYAKKLYENLNSDESKPAYICLVENPRRCFYFSENRIEPSSEIPLGFSVFL